MVMATKKKIPTLSGHVTLTIPAGSQSNDKHRLRGKGVESVNGYGKGDFKFLERLKGDHSEFRFVFGRKFAFRPSKTIVIGPSEPHWRLLLLHEVGHAICKHRSFKMDVERLKMENQAWEEAHKMAPSYGVVIDEGIVQRELDSYRDWLHQKSRCPNCGLTRYQTPDEKYHCPRCDTFMSNKK